MHFPSKVVAAFNDVDNAANKNKDNADDKSDGNRKHLVQSKDQQCERILLSSKLQQTFLFFKLGSF